LPLFIYICVCIHINIYIYMYVYVDLRRPHEHGTEQLTMIYLYICFHIHVYAYICFHIHVYANMCFHIHMYAYICFHIHVYAYIHVCICRLTPPPLTYMYRFDYIFKNTYICVCIYICMYTDLRRPHEHGTEQLTTPAPSSQGALHQNLPHISRKAKNTDAQKK